MSSRWLEQVVIDGNTVNLCIPQNAPPTMGGSVYELVNPSFVVVGDAIIQDCRVEGVQSFLLKGGDYFCFRYRANSYSQGYGIFENSDYTGSVCSIGYGDLWKNSLTLCVAVDDDLEEAQFGIYGERQYGGGPLLVCGAGRTNQNERKAAYQQFLNSQPIHYNWTAWDQIAGNSGQYRCNLTKIKDESIGDFSAIQTGDSTDFTRISSQASLMNIFHNMSYGVEQKVAWSGSNYLTMELATVSGLPNQVDLIFRFYIPASSSSAVYTQTQRMTWDGTYRDKDIYLSFVHDDTQQAAILLPILDNYYTGQYSWGWSGGTPSTDDMLYVWLWLQASGSPQADSPYSTGTTDNGGTHGGPTPQDQIQTPSAPALDGTSSGMFTIYCPDDTELQHIASFLWDSSTISAINKYFNNFSDNIISLYVLPYKGSNLPSKVFTVGNLSSGDTDLSAVEYVTARFVKIDMGSVTIKPFWDSYLDYSPYSKMEIYLPGCGVQQLDVDDIMCPTLQDGSLPTPEGSTISLEYMLDLMTGVLVAFVKINGELRYQFPGKIGYQIPLTGENYASLVRGYITATAGLIGMTVTGGAAAPFAAGAAAAGIINAMKPDVYRGGNLSGDASMLSYKTPYLIYRRPNKPLLNDQEKFIGFPSYKIDTLSNFSGYTEVIDCHVEGFSCTDEEREKILAALKGGVII